MLELSEPIRHNLCCLLPRLPRLHPGGRLGLSGGGLYSPMTVASQAAVGGADRYAGWLVCLGNFAPTVDL
jgi:hypothetical protein